MSVAGAAVLLLARHGETVWHTENRYAGGGDDIDLTPLGRRQALLLADWVATDPPAAVISSPVRRAVETATPSAEAIGRQLEVLEDLREVSFGLGNGHTLAELGEIDADMVARFRRDPLQHPFPGAEAPASAAARAAVALRQLADRYPGQRVLVVAHNTLLRLALCELLDLPLHRYREIFPRLDNAAITQLRLQPGRRGPAALLSLNVPLQSSSKAATGPPRATPTTPA